MALLNFPLAWVWSMELFLWICWALSLNHLNMHTLFLLSNVNHWKSLIVSNFCVWGTSMIYDWSCLWIELLTVSTLCNNLNEFNPDFSFDSWWSKAYDYYLFLASLSTCKIKSPNCWAMHEKKPNVCDQGQI